MCASGPYAPRASSSGTPPERSGRRSDRRNQFRRAPISSNLRKGACVRRARSSSARGPSRPRATPEHRPYSGEMAVPPTARAPSRGASRCFIFHISDCPTRYRSNARTLIFLGWVRNVHVEKNYRALFISEQRTWSLYAPPDTSEVTALTSFNLRDFQATPVKGTCVREAGAEQG